MLTRHKKAAQVSPRGPFLKGLQLHSNWATLLRGFLERLGLVGEFPGDVRIVDFAGVTIVGALVVERRGKQERDCTKPCTFCNVL